MSFNNTSGLVSLAKVQICMHQGWWNIFTDINRKLVCRVKIYIPKIPFSCLIILCDKLQEKMPSLKLNFINIISIALSTSTCEMKSYFSHQLKQHCKWFFVCVALVCYLISSALFNMFQNSIYMPKFYQDMLHGTLPSVKVPVFVLQYSWIKDHKGKHGCGGARVSSSVDDG